MQVLARLNKSKSRGVIAAFASSLALAPASAALAQTQLQNFVPAAYSFDNSLAVLGILYGIDPAKPVFTAEGTVTDLGFSWITSGLYLGQPLTLSNTGTFDPITSTLTWAGGGNYAGTPWALDGTTVWSSPSDFGLKDSISIGGTLATFSEPVPRRTSISEP